MIAGALVGLSEAMYILGGASTGEYGALLYATVLYGILGLCGGIGIGGGLWVLSLVKLRSCVTALTPLSRMRRFSSSYSTATKPVLGSHRRQHPRRPSQTSRELLGSNGCSMDSRAMVLNALENGESLQPI